MKRAEPENGFDAQDRDRHPRSPDASGGGPGGQGGRHQPTMRRDDHRGPPRGAPAGGPRDRQQRPRGSFPLELPPLPNILQEVEVHRSLVGKIIGPRGETAAGIRQAARCFLHIRKENRADNLQVVEISGDASQVKSGLDKVLQLVKEEVGEDKGMQPKVLPQAVTYFDVLPEMVGYVLGTRGQTVKQVREKTNTQVQITDANPETGLQAITIRGVPDNVQEAYIIIRTMLEKYDPRRTKGVPAGLSLTPTSGVNARMGPAAGGGGHRGPPEYPGHLDGPPHSYDMPPPYDQQHLHMPGRGPPSYPAPDYGAPDHADPYNRQPGPMGHAAAAPSYRPRDDAYSVYGGRDRAPPTYGAPDPYAPEYRDRQGLSMAPAASAPVVPASAVAPAGTAPPPVLVLHSDGTYRPAPAGMAAQAPAQASTAAALTTMLTQLVSTNPAFASLAAALQQQVAGAGTAGAPGNIPQAGPAVVAGQYGSAPAQLPQQQQQPYQTQPVYQGYGSSVQSQPAAPQGYAGPGYVAGSQQHGVQQEYAGGQGQYAAPVAQPGHYGAAQGPYARQGADAMHPQQQLVGTGGAAAAHPGSAGTLPGGMSMDQLQNYYSRYAVMYAQAAAQQQGAQSGPADPPQ